MGFECPTRKSLNIVTHQHEDVADPHDDDNEEAYIPSKLGNFKYYGLHDDEFDTSLVVVVQHIFASLKQEKEDWRCPIIF